LALTKDEKPFTGPCSSFHLRSDCQSNA